MAAPLGGHIAGKVWLLIWHTYLAVPSVPAWNRQPMGAILMEASCWTVPVRNPGILSLKAGATLEVGPDTGILSAQAGILRVRPKPIHSCVDAMESSRNQSLALPVFYTVPHHSQLVRLKIPSTVRATFLPTPAGMPMASPRANLKRAPQFVSHSYSPGKITYWFTLSLQLQAIICII